MNDDRSSVDVVARIYPILLLERVVRVRCVAGFIVEMIEWHGEVLRPILCIRFHRLAFGYLLRIACMCLEVYGMGTH